MKLIPPVPNSSIPAIADWIELNAFVRKKTTQSEIVGWLQIDEEDNQGSKIEKDANIENLIDDSFFEIARRQKAAPDSYPFSIDPTGTHVGEKDDLVEGGAAYIFCLLVSEYRRSQMLDSAVFQNLQESIEDLFQICGTLAAAGLVDGNSISFGFPRPDGSGFLSILQRTYSLVKEGTPLTSPRPGVSPWTKDGGVDVVAWRHFPDENPGKIYLLGQCASGHDFLGKKVPKRKFHEDWFTDIPATDPILAIFIPFVLDEHWRVTKNHSLEETRRGFFSTQTRSLGLVIDRCRLAHLVSRGVEFAKKNPQKVERAEEFFRISEWIETARNQIMA